jgi:cobalt-zinc-cadmium resistance protein CzcA
VSLLEVRPRPLEASRQNVSPAAVLNHVQALRVGLEVGSTYDGPVRIPVRVRLLSPVNALNLEQMSLPMADGKLLPLSSVAEVVRRATPSMVNHDEAQRRVVVGFNVRERDLGSVVKDAEAAMKGVAVPEGVRVEWGGQYEGLQSAQKRLSVVIPAVLLLIFTLLLVLFRQIRPAFLILLNVPFAAVGGMVSLFLRDMPVSISAAIGFIALSGIAVLNGVVLMNAILGFEREGVSSLEAVRQAAESRMRPVLMTAGVAALGFVPMMVAQGVGAEVQRPLATVVVGGLLTSTYLTLVILPALYSWRRKPLGLPSTRSR